MDVMARVRHANVPPPRLHTRQDLTRASDITAAVAGLPATYSTKATDTTAYSPPNSTLTPQPSPPFPPQLIRLYNSTSPQQHTPANNKEMPLAFCRTFSSSMAQQSAVELTPEHNPVPDPGTQALSSPGQEHSYDPIVFTHSALVWHLKHFGMGSGHAEAGARLFVTRGRKATLAREKEKSVGQGHDRVRRDTAPLQSKIISRCRLKGCAPGRKAVGRRISSRGSDCVREDTDKCILWLRKLVCLSLKKGERFAGKKRNYTRQTSLTRKATQLNIFLKKM